MFTISFIPHPAGLNQINKTNYWQLRSIDTVKYSRDLARQSLKDKSIDSVIETQVKNIAATGANYISVGTPYDAEFLPVIYKWVKYARDNNLHVWFRGNESGWEGWFGYPKITPEEHTREVVNFVLNNPSLFANGDIFTSCTECENGNIGDPRKTGDVVNYRKFLLNENALVKAAFDKISKNVISDYYPMNADVARLVMDKRTTEEMGGVVVIDHYVNNGVVLKENIDEIAINSGGKVVLGEFGAPLPGITQDMNDNDQANWLKNTLEEITQSNNLLGVNYWVGVGGTTALWRDDGTAKEGVNILSSYFSPQNKVLKVENSLGKTISVNMLLGQREIPLNNGQYVIPFVTGDEKISISKAGYKDMVISIRNISNSGIVDIKSTNGNILLKLMDYLKFNGLIDQVFWI